MPGKASLKFLNIIIMKSRNPKAVSWVGACIEAAQDEQFQKRIVASGQDSEDHDPEFL
jgi:hypothetical protein